jgi:hypothetical protein
MDCRNVGVQHGTMGLPRRRHFPLQLLRVLSFLFCLNTGASCLQPSRQASTNPAHFRFSAQSNSSTEGMPESTKEETAACSIANFRLVAGINNVFRCASTDGLGDQENADLSGPDIFVFEEAGLILDLRSASERNEASACNWMARAPRGPMTVVEANERYSRKRSNPEHKRFVVRCDVLSPSRFMSYIEQNWLSPAEKARSALFKIIDGKKLHELRIESLNARGLAGLNEAILETGKQDILSALQTITLHLEANKDDSVIIHCVQGKDRYVVILFFFLMRGCTSSLSRLIMAFFTHFCSHVHSTGMLVMLLQSLLEISDEIIVDDYFKSNQMRNGSAAADSIRRKGRLDRNFFSGTSPEAMETTLKFLRSKYGSVSPGYLDQIGFDERWRQRLVVALMLPPTRSML